MPRKLPIENTRKVVRLALHGCTNRPFYHVVVMWNRHSRDKPPLETLGVYDPMQNIHGQKLVALNFMRIKELFMKDVEFSKPVLRLLGLCGFLPLHPSTILQAHRANKKNAENLANMTDQGTDSADSSTQSESDNIIVQPDDEDSEQLNFSAVDNDKNRPEESNAHNPDGTAV